MRNDLFEKLLNKSITKEELAQITVKNPKLIPTILDGVHSSKASIRYGCASVLKLISEEKPEKLYQYMDFFIQLLDSKYRILTWIGIVIIANLSVIDKENKFEKIFTKYYSFLDNEYMVTVANVVGNSGKIAIAKPYLSQKISNELLKVENISTTPHLSNECKNVIIEKTIKSFDMYYNSIHNKEEIISFVTRQLKNSRKSVRTEAEKFLKKWN